MCYRRGWSIGLRLGYRWPDYLDINQSVSRNESVKAMKDLGN